MTFSSDLTRITEKYKRRINNVVKSVVVDIGERLVEKSPVGNPSLWKNPLSAPEGYVGGAFRANWQHGLNSYPLTTIDSTDNDVSARIEQGAMAGRLGDSHYIVNNLPYSIRLEDGWSTQAPGGIVGLTVTEFGSIVNKVAHERSVD
jgi:hypothetical protein